MGVEIVEAVDGYNDARNDIHGTVRTTCTSPGLPTLSVCLHD